MNNYKYDRVGFDIDGVLADFHPALNKVAEKMYGSVTTETRMKAEASILDKEDENFWFNLKPVNALASMVDWDIHQGCTYRYFITRRPPCTQGVTTRWLTKHFGFNSKDILISGAVEKGRIVQGLYLQSFYDDDPVHCIQVARYSPTTMVWLVDKPYNQWFDVAAWNKKHCDADSVTSICRGIMRTGK